MMVIQFKPWEREIYKAIRDNTNIIYGEGFAIIHDDRIFFNTNDEFVAIIIAMGINNLSRQMKERN